MFVVFNFHNVILPHENQCFTAVNEVDINNLTCCQKLRNCVFLLFTTMVYFLSEVDCHL